MLIIGLTGSIGMGKSTMAEALRQQGVDVLDADQVVHDLYQGAAVADIEAMFPGTTHDGQVDRSKLSAALADNPDGFQRLESVVHPMVWQAQADFLHQQHAKNAKMAVLEIPLLFETGGQDRVDVVIVVSASPETQAERVLARPGMTAEKLDQLRARQMPDTEKRKRADFIVDTDLEPHQSAAQITDILSQIASRKGEVFDHYWRQKSED